MGIGVLCLLLGLQIWVCRALVCTPPYKNILGVCVHLSPSKLSWCNAQKFCLSVGGELVRGKTFLALAGKRFPGMPYHYWIGLTDFVNERRNKRDGWRWSDGSLDPPSEKLPWHSLIEPGNSGPADCVLQCHSSGKVCDVTCPSNFAQALCQPRLKSELETRDFTPSDILVGQTQPYTSEGNGCSKAVSNVGDFIDCAVQCRITDMCASLYFNKAKRSCHLMLYTDANFNLESADGWKKLLMK